MIKKIRAALLFVAVGLFISIVKIDIANAANLTTDADNVDSLIEINDIIEKEMQKSTDSTKFNIFYTVGDYDFSWSPDGSKLLVLAHRNMMTKGLDSIYDTRRVKCGEFGLHERASTLFWMYADGSEITNIARAEESIRAAKNNSATFIQSAWWSSSGDKIVLLLLNPCAEKPHNLYVSDRNGSILAEVKGLDYPLIQWSPNRNKIAILDHPPNDTLIYAIDVENSTVKQLPIGKSAAGYQNDIKYNPDGEKIAFIGNKDGNIYTVDVDNSSFQQLTTDIEARGLTWKPDGKKLVFVAVDGLYVMDADGSNLKLIEKENFSLGLWSIGSWSLDGKKLLFTTADVENRNYKLRVFDIDRGTGGLIDAKWVSYITWSPNSDRIAFISADSKNVYTVNSDGTNKVTLPENYFAEMESAYGWGMDRIYYLTKDSLVKANPDGTESPLVRNIPTNIYSSNEMSLSPDGGRILLTLGNMLKRERNSNSYVLKLKGYDEVMSIYAPSSIKQGDAAFIEANSMSKPVENAVISLNGMEIGKTNETGFLKYSFKETGNFRLSAVKQGFRTVNKSITVQESPSGQSSPEQTLTAAPQITESTAATVTPKAPGFDAALAIGILFTINLFKRRYKLRA